MKKIIGVATIILILCGSAVAADYWRLGVGVRGEGVIPGGDHANALGTGIVVSFSDPDSRFATQFEFDTWEVSYTYDGSDDTQYYYRFITATDSVKTGFETIYSGFGAGLYEKVRLFNLISRVSTYAVGGIGGYFLELQQEEEVELVPGYPTPEMRSKYLHARFMAAGGIGFDIDVAERWVAMIEGRYVYIESELDKDEPLMKAFLGLKYNF
jgi:hypothetical protein